MQVRDVWHSRKVAVMGLPTDKAEWPSAAQLLPMLRSRPGRPVSAQDIEADVITLLSTVRGASCDCTALHALTASLVLFLVM